MSAQPAAISEITVVNGVNVTALGQTIEAVSNQPTLAKFQFRARNRWFDGGHNRSEIKDFHGAGEEDSTRTAPFVLEADEPPVLLGEDRGPNPVEFVLHALAACLTTSMVYHAAARGIRIESIESTLEGDLDLHGFLGLREDVRKGYQQIRATFNVKSTASAEQLRELTKMSPVFDVVSNPVPVQIEMNVEAPTD